MNRKIGMAGSLVTLAAVWGFALSMLFGSLFASYLTSMFIAWGFVPLICSFASQGEKDTKAAGYAAIAFASVYAVLIMLVYFAQLTTVRLSSLNEQAAGLINYGKFGLFFNYDLLGYAFMALATFFAAFTVRGKSQGTRWLKGLLLVHGIFAISCVIMPMLGIFKADMKGGEWIGTAVLEFWCTYFTPVCILSFLHFKGNQAE